MPDFLEYFYLSFIISLNKYKKKCNTKILKLTFTYVTCPVLHTANRTHTTHLVANLFFASMMTSLIANIAKLTHNTQNAFAVKLIASLIFTGWWARFITLTSPKACFAAVTYSCASETFRFFAVLWTRRITSWSPIAYITSSQATTILVIA